MTNNSKLLDFLLFLERDIEDLWLETAALIAKSGEQLSVLSFLELLGLISEIDEPIVVPST